MAWLTTALDPRLSPTNVRTVGRAGQYKTIQAAIDASADGDVIIISAGTYNENLVFTATEGLTLIGEDPLNTIVQQTRSDTTKLLALPTNASTRFYNIGFDDNWQGSGGLEALCSLNVSGLDVEFHNCTFNVDGTGGTAGTISCFEYGATVAIDVKFLGCKFTQTLGGITNVFSFRFSGTGTSGIITCVNCDIAYVEQQNTGANARMQLSGCLIDTLDLNAVTSNLESFGGINRVNTLSNPGTVNGFIHQNATGQIQNVKTLTYEEEHDNGSQGASWTLDWNNGQKQKVTLTASTTSLTITAPPSVGNFQLKIIQGGAGNFGITWPGTVLWPNGQAPNLTNAAGSEDIVSFYWDGTNYYGVASLDFK